MSSKMLIAKNPYQTTASTLARTTDALQAKRDDVNAKAAEKMQGAKDSAHDASAFARSAGQTAWMGVKETMQGFKSVAVGSAMAGAGVGFAAAGAMGAVGAGVATVTKKALGGIARGFLFLSNALARAAGQPAAAKMAPTQGPQKQSFADRMFAKMRASFSASGTALKASAPHFATGARVGVLGTTANLALATGASVTSTSRVLAASAYKMTAASLWGAQACIGVAKVSVTEAQKGATAVRDAAAIGPGGRGGRVAVTGQPA